MSIFKTKIKNKRGMTLVEIIVALGLTGIIATLIIPFFSTGMIIAVKSGDNTDVAMTAQGLVDSKISGLVLNDTGDGNVTISPASDPDTILETVEDAAYSTTTETVTINLNSDPGENISVEGDWVETDSYSDDNETSYTIYKPENSYGG